MQLVRSLCSSIAGLTRQMSTLTCQNTAKLPQTCLSTRTSQDLLSRCTNLLGTSLISRPMASLIHLHKRGPGSYKKYKPRSPQLEGCPHKRGIVLKTLIKKPKKPNSANRRCVLVRLSTGQELIAYVPGEGHNLQEHSVVLVQGGGLQDTPGVNLTCVRGKYDLAQVKKKDR